VNTLIAALERAIDGKMGAGDLNLLRAHVEKLRRAQEAWQHPDGRVLEYALINPAWPDVWRRVWVVEAT